MPVIARRRAEEFYPSLPTPRLTAAHPAAVCLGNIIKHQIQTGVAAHNHIFGCHLQNIREQLLRLRNPVEQAIVAHIGAVRHPASAAHVHTGEHIHRQVQLLRAGLSAGHIQLQPLRARRAVLRLQRAQTGLQLFPGQVLQHWHEEQAPFRLQLYS